MLEKEVAILNTWFGAMTPGILGYMQVWILLALKNMPGL